MANGYFRSKIKGKYCFAVIDDCSRYCLGLFALNRVSTDIIIHLLDTLFKIHGKPREILTDNGNVFGLKVSIQSLIGH